MTNAGASSSPKKLVLCSILGAIIAVCIVNLPGCITKSVTAKPPVVIPAAPNPSGVIGDHKNREQVQGVATDKIDNTVKGTPAEEPVKEQTNVIRQANVNASADQVAKLADDFGITVSAQAAEIKRLGSENTRITTENADLVKKNGELQARLDDFGRKVAVYTANGLGALLLLVAVGLGVLTKNLQYVGWCLLGSLCGFGAARIIGHWIFPWIIGVSVIIVAGGFTISHMAQRKKQAEKDRLLKAADDVIGGVEEVRDLFKNPTAEIAEIVRNADTPEKAIEAVKRMGLAINKTLSGWVTDHDGTADVIRARRRALGLIS